MNLPRNLLLSMLLVIATTSMALVAIVALRYSYSTSSAAESGVGFALLLIVAVSLWLYRRRSSQRRNSPATNRAILVGIALGLLWMIEIGINNFIAPPLPARDIIDNIFWAAIALSILALAIICAYQTDSIAHGVEVGAWSGLASGLVACAMALSVIVFGIRFITQDPLNVAEWAERGTSSAAPTRAAYFAFETFAGAFGHLLVLGVGMGGLLGAAAELVEPATEVAPGGPSPESPRGSRRIVGRRYYRDCHGVHSAESAKCRVTGNTMGIRLSVESRDDPSFAHAKGAIAT